MAYAAALFPDTRTACGVRLLPMEMGHALLLQRLGSPFAGEQQRGGSEGARPVTYADVLVACLVCSRPWSKSAAAVNSWRGALWLKWKWATRRWRVGADTLALLEWNREQWEAPPFQPVSQRAGAAPPRRRGTEWLHVLVGFCCQHLGCSHHEALSVPLRVATYDYLAHMEEQGAINIDGETESELDRLAREHQAEMAAKGTPVAPMMWGKN